MAVVLAAAIGRTVLDKTSYSSPGQDGAEHSRLEVLSERPLSRRALERVLEDRYLPVPDDDEADVHCSGRIAKPAHSVRRCEVIYSEGVRRGIVLLTNARGAEVLSEP
jgi:hypothetical protein